MGGSRELRLLIYSQDGLGLGHQRRTTLLASEFLRAHPGSSVLTVSDSPLGQFFGSAPGHDFCKLPSVRKAGPGDWEAVSLNSAFPEVLHLRRAMLRTVALSYAPDVLLVDHMPHGAMGELVPALEALQDEPTTVILGLRDILDDPAVVRERWQLEGAHEAVQRYYDRVLVYGSQDVFDLADEYGWPETAREKVRYCGYVCAPPPPAVSRRVRSRYLRRSPRGRLILATAGGGADAYPLFDALLQAAPALAERGRDHLVLVTGPFLPPAQRRELTARAHGLPVTLLTSVSDTVGYMAAADLVIAMAGYNTTAELLSVGTPALLVPRSGPSAEQQMRARLFAERGWVTMLPPQQLSAESLAGAALHALDGAGAADRAPDLAGRVVAAAHLLDGRVPAQRRGEPAAPPAPRRPPAGVASTDASLLA